MVAVSLAAVAGAATNAGWNPGHHRVRSPKSRTTVPPLPDTLAFFPTQLTDDMSRRCADTAAAALMHRPPAPPTCCRGKTIRACGRGGAPFHSRAAVARRRGPSTEPLTDARAAAASGENVAVVGGGLTGLATAYYLAKKLPPSSSITLYESSNRLGGWIKTEDFKVDTAGGRGTIAFERGPRTLSSLTNSNWRFDDLVLYDLALDLGLKLHKPPKGRRRIYYPDHLVSLPPDTTVTQFLSEPLVWDSAPGAFGLFRTMLHRRWRYKNFGPRQPPEDLSVEEWIRDLTGGDAVGNNLASAILHGIYGGDISKLSARSVLDSFFYPFYQNNWNRHTSSTSRLSLPVLDHFKDDPLIQRLAQERKGPMLNLGANGMEALSGAIGDALASQPNVEIKLDEPVREISYDREGQSVGITTAKSGGRPRMYSKVISTIPGQYLAPLTKGALPSLAQLKAVSITTVNLYFPELSMVSNDVGYLIPRSVDYSHNPERALGVFFDSHVIPLRPNEPTGTKLFVLMGGHYYDRDSGGIEPPDEYEAIEQARRLLSRQLNIPLSEPCFAVAGYAKDCIPQHHVGHESRMRSAHGELQKGFEGRLAVAGGSYTHIGTVAALAAGFRAANSFAGSSPDRQATGLEYFTEDSPLSIIPSGLAVRRRK
ncbi:Protoporphyrinogen oxidase [Paramyrothecium foliicola]|nr:Protoporphyrinogen oxidase [Paramyrothecium foliicola]